MITVPDHPQPRGSGQPGKVPPHGVRLFGALWGIGGVAAVLIFAVVSMGHHTVEAVAAGLVLVEWLALLGNSAFMAWMVGYRSLQQRFSPRIAARALHLYLAPSIGRLLLAPLFCTGYFGATPRLRRMVWIGSALILGAVLLGSRIPQPWRGILDAGVLVALSWGTVTLLTAARITFREGRGLVPAEVSPATGL